MPQITLECTQNIVESDFQSFFQHLHAFLTEKLPTQLTSCKSRVIRYDEYCIGDGHKDNAFLVLTIAILPGRTEELLKSVANAVEEQLKVYCAASFKQLNVSIAVMIKALPSIYHTHIYSC